GDSRVPPKPWRRRKRRPPGMWQTASPLNTEPRSSHSHSHSLFPRDYTQRFRQRSKSHRRRSDWMSVYMNGERSPGTDLHRLRRKNFKFWIVRSMPTRNGPEMADQFPFTEIAVN